MRRALLLAGALVSVACAHRGAAAPAPAPVAGGRTGPVAQGTPVDFTAARFPDGQAFTLSQDRGSVVLVDVWATWCEPCRVGLPLYGRLEQEYRDRGLKVYALSVDEDVRYIAKFLADTGATVTVLLDAEARAAEQTLGVQQVPTTFLIDRKGVVRVIHEGLSEDLAEAYAGYRTEIDALLAEPREDGSVTGGR